MSEITPIILAEDTLTFIVPEIGSTTINETVTSFVEKLNSLEGDSMEEMLVKLIQLCYYLDYPIELMCYRPSSVRATITIPEYDHAVVIKHQPSLDYEADILSRLQPYQEEISFPVSYSKGNWSVLEFIDGVVSPYDRTSFAFFAIEQLSRLQKLDLTKLKLVSFDRRHEAPLSDKILAQIANSMVRCGFLGDHTTKITDILEQMQRDRDILFKELLSPEKKDLVLSHGDYTLSNMIFPRANPITKCYIIDWERAGVRPRWYDIASFVHVCAGRSDALEKLYWEHYLFSMQDVIYDLEEENRIFLQYRILATLVCAISQSVIEGNTEFSRSLLALEYLFPQLVSATGG